MKHLERALDNQNQTGKYILVFLAGFIGTNIIGAIPLFVVIVFKTAISKEKIEYDAGNMMDLSTFGIDPNISLILFMIPFIVGLVITVLLIKGLHKRRLKEIINGTNRIRWGRFFFAAVIWLTLSGIWLLVNYYASPENFTLNFNIKSFIPLVFIAVLLIPFQTTYEEVMFRGYLAQGVAAKTRNRWLVILIPAVLFGLMHILNPEVKEYGFWLTMPQYILFGLLFGFVTILDDGIEVAMGAHAAHNVFSVIFITSDASAIQSAALLKQDHVSPVKELFVLFIFCFIFIAILSYKYKWKYSTLNKKT